MESKKYSFLIVDDRDDERELVYTMLENENHIIHTAK